MRKRRVIARAAWHLAALLWLVTACGGAQPSAPRPASLAQLAWLVGAWSDGTVSETWAPADGDVMRGTMTITKRGTTVFSESMKLELVNGTVTMFVLLGQKPGGVPFRAVEQGVQRAVFENPANEFPRRMSYTRDAGLLVIRLEGDAPAQELRLSLREPILR